MCGGPSANCTLDPLEACSCDVGSVCLSDTCVAGPGADCDNVSQCAYNQYCSPWELHCYQCNATEVCCNSTSQCADGEYCSQKWGLCLPCGGPSDNCTLDPDEACCEEGAVCLEDTCVGAPCNNVSQCAYNQYCSPSDLHCHQCNASAHCCNTTAQCADDEYCSQKWGLCLPCGGPGGNCTLDSAEACSCVTGMVCSSGECVSTLPDIGRILGIVYGVLAGVLLLLWALYYLQGLARRRRQSRK